MGHVLTNLEHQRGLESLEQFYVGYNEPHVQIQSKNPYVLRPNSRVIINSHILLVVFTPKSIIVKSMVHSHIKSYEKPVIKVCIYGSC